MYKFNYLFSFKFIFNLNYYLNDKFINKIRLYIFYSNILIKLYIFIFYIIKSFK